MTAPTFEEKLFLTQWFAHRVLAVSCSCVEAQNIDRIYIKENEDSEPDCVFVNHGETIEGVFEYLMDLEGKLPVAERLPY